MQRPGILAEIALDLYVLRLITPIQTRLQNAINGLSTAPEDIEVALQLVDEARPPRDLARPRRDLAATDPRSTPRSRRGRLLGLTSLSP